MTTVFTFQVKKLQNNHLLWTAEPCCNIWRKFAPDEIPEEPIGLLYAPDA